MFPEQKANHFLNKSVAENSLPQGLIRNKKFLRNVLPDCRNSRSFKNPSKSKINLRIIEGV